VNTELHKQKVLAKSVVVMACLSIALGLAGCEGKDTAEKTEQKLDQAAENAHEKMEQQAQKADEYMDESADASKTALENAGKQINQTTEAAGNKMAQARNKAEKNLERAKDSAAVGVETAGIYMDDAMITTQVKTALVNDALLKASKINVSTVNGVVKLSGGVESKQSISRAKAVVSSQAHVKSVESKMSVNLPEQK
jgi:hyperosmotically inducible protein